MKKIAIGLSLAALGIAGTALAEQSMASGHGSDRTTTRVEAIAHAGQLFSRLDVNADGKIDPADREARRTAAFERIDANKDGQISRTEFTAMRPEMGGHGMGGHRMDRKGMGAGGDKPGMSGDHRNGNHMRGHGMRGMMLMRMADSNRDGAVTRDEFATAAATRFDAADTNRDSQLTPAERQAARGAMRERMHSMRQHAMPDGAATPSAPQ
jgi:Ca2+-binding EF-hand superfamily protein